MFIKRNIAISLTFVLCLSTALPPLWAVGGDKDEAIDPALSRGKRNAPADDIFDEDNFDGSSHSAEEDERPTGVAVTKSKPAYSPKCAPSKDYKSLVQNPDIKSLFLQYKCGEITREHYQHELSKINGEFTQHHLKSLNTHMLSLYRDEITQRKKTLASSKKKRERSEEISEGDSDDKTVTKNRKGASPNADREEALRRDLEILNGQKQMGEAALSFTEVGRKHNVTRSVVMHRWVRYGFDENYDRPAHREDIQSLYRQLQAKKITLKNYKQEIIALEPNLKQDSQIISLNIRLKELLKPQKNITHDDNTLLQDLELRNQKILSGEAAPSLKDLAIKHKVSTTWVHNQCARYGFNKAIEEFAAQENIKNLYLQYKRHEITREQYEQELRDIIDKAPVKGIALLNIRLIELYWNKPKKNGAVSNVTSALSPQNEKESEEDEGSEEGDINFDDNEGNSINVPATVVDRHTNESIEGSHLSEGEEATPSVQVSKRKSAKNKKRERSEEVSENESDDKIVTETPKGAEPSADREEALRRDLEILNGQKQKGEATLSFSEVARRHKVTAAIVQFRWIRYGFDEHYNRLAHREDIQSLYRQLKAKKISLKKYKQEIIALEPNLNKDRNIVFLNFRLKELLSQQINITHDNNTLRQDLEIRHQKILRDEAALSLHDLARKHKVSSDRVRRKWVRYGFNKAIEEVATQENIKTLYLKYKRREINFEQYEQKLRDNIGNSSNNYIYFLKMRLRELYSKEIKVSKKGAVSNVNQPLSVSSEPALDFVWVNDLAVGEKDLEALDFNVEFPEKESQSKPVETALEDINPSDPMLGFTFWEEGFEGDGIHYDELEFDGQSFVDLDPEKQKYSDIVYKSNQDPLIQNDADKVGVSEVHDDPLPQPSDRDNGKRDRDPIKNTENSRFTKKSASNVHQVDEATVVTYLKQRKEDEKKKIRVASLRAKAKEFGMNEFDLLQLKYKYGLDDRIEALAQREENQNLYLLCKKSGMKKKDFVSLFIGSNEDGGKSMHGATVSNVLLRLDYLYKSGALRNDTTSSPNPVIADAEDQDVDIEPAPKKQTLNVTAAEFAPPPLSSIEIGSVGDMEGLLDFLTPDSDFGGPQFGKLSIDGMEFQVLESVAHQPMDDGK